MIISIVINLVLLIITISFGLVAHKYKRSYLRLTEEHQELIEANKFIRSQIDKSKTKP